MADRLVDATVALDRLDGARPAECGGDPQDPGAGAEVEDTSPPASVPGALPGERGQAQPGGGVESGSESAAGVDDQGRRHARR